MGELEDVLARAAAGDEVAWREIVAHYQRLVFATIRSFRIPPEDADDLFQDAFLRLHRHALRLRDSRALTRWLIVTTRHLCLDHLSRRRTMTRIPPVDDPATEGPIDETLAALERAQWVRDALAALGPRCRDLLLLLFFEQERPDYREAATRLGIPIGSVGPTRARCLDQLLRALRRRERHEERSS